MNETSRRVVLAVVLSGLVGCGGTSAGSDAGLPDEPTAEDRDQLKSALSGQSTTTNMLTAADSFFDFDPVLDTTKTAEANAQAISANIKAKGSACVTTTVSGGAVTADFGAPPGCTLSTGVTLSGSVSLSVSKASSSLTVAMTFTSFAVDGTSLTGSATFVTSNGSTFQVTANLVTGSDTVVANLTVTGQPASFVLDGASSITEGSKVTKLDFAKLHAAAGQCYADAGAMTVTKASLVSTLTFDAQTPSTGKVKVTQGKRSYTATLPAYGKCPKGADAGP
jgi:hypothetical protein